MAVLEYALRENGFAGPTVTVLHHICCCLTYVAMDIFLRVVLYASLIKSGKIYDGVASYLCCVKWCNQGMMKLHCGTIASELQCKRQAARAGLDHFDLWVCEWKLKCHEKLYT